MRTPLRLLATAVCEARCTAATRLPPPASTGSRSPITSSKEIPNRFTSADRVPTDGDVRPFSTSESRLAETPMADAVLRRLSPWATRAVRMRVPMSSSIMRSTPAPPRHWVV